MKFMTVSLITLAGWSCQAWAQEPALPLSAAAALSHRHNASSGQVGQPQDPGLNQQPGLTPYVALPPESLEPRTLVVPLPSEGGPAVVTRKNAYETVPQLQPSLPKASGKNPLPPIVD